MSVQRVAERYAKSLLDYGLDNNQLDHINEDIRSLSKALEQRELELFVKSPIIQKSKKRKVFKKLFEGQLSTVTVSFIDILTRKGREGILNEICQAFVRLYNTHKSISYVKVTTAVPLSPAMVEEVRNRLIESKLTDTQIDLQLNTDPSIIGGLIIEIEDKLYDASIAYKLKQLKDNFIESNLSLN